MIELLSNTGYIMVNKTLIKRIGLHEALMLGELCSEYSYWKSTGKLDEEGYFFSTRENIEENIGLSSFQQRKAMTTLKELGIIEEIAKGLPAKNYYRIIESRIAEIMDAEGVNNKMSNNLTTGHEEIKQQDEKKLKRELLERQLKNIETKIDSIYDDKLNGIIAQNDFKRMYDGYVNQRIQIERQIQDFKNQKEEIEDRLDLDKIVKDFISMKNITSTIITMLVSKIEITQNKEVYIHYRFKELQKSAS